MDQRPNNYNDQGPNGQGPNGNGGPGGPKNKSSLLVLLICVLATLLIWTVFISGHFDIVSVPDVPILPSILPSEYCRQKSEAK